MYVLEISMVNWGLKSMHEKNTMLKCRAVPVMKEDE